MLEKMKNGMQLDPRLANQAIINHQQTHNNMHVEESVDELIRKLENQGKKIKIINDDDNDEIQSDIGPNDSPQKSARGTGGAV